MARPPPRAWIASHPDVYDEIGAGYARYRRPDPRIQAQIGDALGDARTVCNVGAGAGSYEPPDRTVVAVEPARRMLAQRARPGVRAVAEALPFAAGAFDAALATLTVHHWHDLDAGLAELRRIAPRRVLLVFDPDPHDTFWLVRDYLPEIQAMDREAPSIARIVAAFGDARVETIPVPWDCTDGFLAAYWRRPERYLEPDVRACISGIARLEPGIAARGIAALREDLESGRWHARHADLLAREAMDWGYRLIVSES